MIAWFRRRAMAHTTPELASTLRAAAGYADTPAAAAEYMAAADALDRACNLTERHADTPTRDALAYALGRAELGLRDQLSELIEIAKNDRMDFQALDKAIDDVLGEQAKVANVLNVQAGAFRGHTDAIEALISIHTATRLRVLETDVTTLKEQVHELMELLPAKAIGGKIYDTKEA